MVVALTLSATSTVRTSIGCVARGPSADPVIANAPKPRTKGPPSGPKTSRS